MMALLASIRIRTLALIVSIALVVLLAMATTVWVELARRDAAPADRSHVTPMVPSTNGDSMPAPTGSVARGDVTIDARRQQLIGVRTVRAERRQLAREIRTVGLVRYDESRVADVNLKVEAWIRTLDVDYTGQFVRKGQPLFTVYSPELLATQQEYLLALRARDQARQSPASETYAIEYADRLVEAARRRLVLWDLSPDEMRAMEQPPQTQSAVVFRSPVTGFVTEKRAVQGLHVMPGESLYRIADLSVVWVEADVYERELPSLRRGAPATITLDAYPGMRFQGHVTYVYPFVEEKTRTVKARFELPNRDARLKPGMFANVVLSSATRSGLVVPLDAVLDSGTEQIVFVTTGDGHFEPRHVSIGQRLGDAVEIRDGVAEGEQVATGAAFFLDSESQLRASLPGFEPVPTGTTATGTTAPTAPAAESLQIAFRSQPEPLKIGDNLFEVAIRTSDGKPVDGADVTIVFFMAAMPAMNMPATRTDTKLSRVGNGVYRGSGTLATAGRWDVTVLVSRGGQRIGTKQLTAVSR
jgi:Cu(I)/Ag(I) efflux system membrane fusion protein/cobalt-zinc-cadmium efflux system membrane fusion protein